MNPYLKNKAEHSDNIITIGMSDDERYEMLKDRTISVPYFDTNKLEQIDADDYEALERIGKSGAFKILRKIGEDFGVFREYTTQDVNIEFRFSRNNLYESIHKQQNEYLNYARMLSVFDVVINNAIGIEFHKERYNNPDSRIEQVYVLFSAFIGAYGIVPVLLEVKTYTDDTSSSLYVAVSLREIKRSRIVGYTPGEYSTEPYPLPASFELSLADLLSNVNIEDKNLLKYVPNGFLNDEQKTAKQVALKETADYINKKNKRYTQVTDKSVAGDSFVSETGVGYTEIENDIVLCFCVSLTNLTGRQP